MLLDTLKGAASLLLAERLGLSEGERLWVGIAAIAGHNWPLFLHCQSGQGMATTVGVFFLLLPTETVATLVFIAVLLAATHNWDLSFAFGLGCLPMLMFWTTRPTGLIVYVVLVLPPIGVPKWMQRLGRWRTVAIRKRRSR